MYKKISQIITHKFVTLGIISEDDYEIYKYGFELLIALLSTTSAIVLVSIFINKFVETILYLVGFFSVRMICGGYHAKHHYTCFVTTISFYFLFLLLNSFFISKQHLWLEPIFITMISVILIVAFAPIEHIYNPMTNYRKKRNRVLSLTLSIIICLIYFVSLFFEKIQPYTLCLVLGIFIATLTLLIAKIEIVIIKRKEVQK